MKIATWNVNGVRARREQVLEWVRRDEPDVVCLQEIKARPEQIPQDLAQLEGYRCYWHGAGGYSGVALLFRNSTFPEAPAISHPAFDRETRIVEAMIDGLVFVSVYVPNGGKDFAAKMQFLQEMVEYGKALRLAGKKLVLCGDMNVTRTELDVHPKERADVIGQRPDERELFGRVIGEGLVDLGRHFDPTNAEMYTWWAPWRSMRAKNIGWRLDYILVSEDLAGKASACPVLKDVGTSDHAPVVATIAL
jgi:exodeoxyribonuclease-3